MLAHARARSVRIRYACGRSVGFDNGGALRVYHPKHKGGGMALRDVNACGVRRSGGGDRTRCGAGDHAKARRRRGGTAEAASPRRL
eukprot:gene6366-12490_t